MGRMGWTMVAGALAMGAACGGGGGSSNVLTATQHAECAAACDHLAACGPSDDTCVSRCEGGVVQHHEDCVSCRAGKSDCALLESECSDSCSGVDDHRGHDDGDVGDDDGGGGAGGDDHGDLGDDHGGGGAGGHDDDDGEGGSDQHRHGGEGGAGGNGGQGGAGGEPIR